MAKRRFLEQGWREDPWFKAVVGALRSCKTEAEMADMLRDIGTLSELQAWSERLEVAKQLARGLSYRQVAEQTGASTTTVTRVARFLEGGEGGYRRYLKTQKTELRKEAPVAPLSALEELQRRRSEQRESGNGSEGGSSSALKKYLK